MMKSIMIEVEFEDLDAGSVVYHPNYIKICERARNRWLAEHGITFGGLKSKDIALAIRAIKADYLRPVFLEPVLVEMSISSFSEKSITIKHDVFPASSMIRSIHFTAEITLVAANYSIGRSCPLPDEVREFLRSFPIQVTP